jgi:hypothetical protein
VEDNDDLRELVVELVTVAFQRRCVGVGSYEELVALGDEALGAAWRFSTSTWVPTDRQASA